jgi:hypothetical protein
MIGFCFDEKMEDYTTVGSDVRFSNDLLDHEKKTLDATSGVWGLAGRA